MQSVSQQFEFQWKSTDLHQPGSTGQRRLTAIVANAIFIRLDKWDISISSCSSVHHFVRRRKKCDMWHVTCDTWHLTHDTWHMIHDMWHVWGGGVNILSKFQPPRSYCLWFMILWRSGGKGSLNESVNDKAVYRTAPATPGLLNIHGLIIEVLVDEFFMNYFYLFNYHNHQLLKPLCVQCTVYSVQCMVHSVRCTVYGVQCTVYSVGCTVYSVVYTLLEAASYNVLYWAVDWRRTA